MKTLGAYARVSTEEQAKEGFSIEAQTKILQAYAIVKGYDNVIMYVDDGYSGKNLRRPEVQRMIADCKAHRLDGVAVWRYDRLSRSLRDTLSLVEDIFNANGIAFISTSEQIDTTTPSGRLVLNILASCAQNEREVTEQRVRMVCMELAKQCKHMGGLPPFGYRVVNERLQVYEPEAEAVRTLFRMYTEGHGYGDLLKYLDDNGFTTIRGNSFRKNSLYEILGNEKYIGVYTYNRTVAADKNGRRNNHANKTDDEIIRVDGGVPAIIDMETWRRAVEKRITNKKRTGVYKAKSVYLLTGLAVCGKCGRKIGGNTGGTDRDGTMQRYYVAPCKHVRRVRKEKIEEFAINFIKYIASDPTIINQTVVSLNELIENDCSAIDTEAAAFQSQLSEIRQKIANINEFVMKQGTDAPASLLETLYTLERQKNTLTLALDEMSLTNKKVSVDAVLDLLSNLQNIDEHLPEDQKAAICRVFDEVRLYDDRFVLAMQGTKKPLSADNGLSV